MNHSGTDWIFSEHTLFSLRQDLFANSSLCHLVGWLGTIQYDFNEKVEALSSNNSPLSSGAVLTKVILVEEKCRKGAHVYSLLKEFCFRKKYCSIISYSTKISPEIRRACLVHPHYPSEAGLASCIILTPFSDPGILEACTWQTTVPREHRTVVTNPSAWPEHVADGCPGVSCVRVSPQPRDRCPRWGRLGRTGSDGRWFGFGYQETGLI